MDKIRDQMPPKENVLLSLMRPFVSSFHGYRPFNMREKPKPIHSFLSLSVSLDVVRAKIVSEYSFKPCSFPETLYSFSSTKAHKLAAAAPTRASESQKPVDFYSSTPLFTDLLFSSDDACSTQLHRTHAP